MSGSTALWLTVVALGLYHGLNPAMGWPLAVANGMTERRGGAVFATILPLGGGHLAAMALVLLPFAWLTWLVEWNGAIRMVAGAPVLAFGVYRWIQPRHPRALARVKPSRLAWWSFLMATAHGAGLMLLPVMLPLCMEPSALNAAAGAGTAVALLVAAVHTLAMMAAGLAMAWAVYRYLGLRFVQRAWFNLDRVWAASLVLAGVAGMLTALPGSPLFA